MDLLLVILVVVGALGFRWMTNGREMSSNPNMRKGPRDHSKMPEMKYVAPMEANEFNATKFQDRPGSGKITGVFGMENI